jgi:tetratricopeptide (TPR) repeat protein
MKKIQPFLLSLAILLGVVSCQDFLTLEPLNDVVLENFWKEKGDIESVVTSCYYNLQSSSVIKSLFVWGELRSDNIIAGMSIGTTEQDILEANILPENTYASWSPFYNVINLCNTVIYYAPGVQQYDQTLTNSELNSYIAEMKALRALCYFYLVRTFHELPLVLDATIGDDVDFEVAPSSQEEVINQIIRDLEEAEPDIREIYAKEVYNKGRITRLAVQSILADAYLWKGDYAKCIEYCQKVIDYKQQEFDKYTLDDIVRFNGYPLILTDYTTIQNYNYNRIFGVGNSFESIFELQFSESFGQSNSLPSSYFGTSGNPIGPLSAPGNIGMSGQDVLFVPSDVRRVQSLNIGASASLYPISKYAATAVSVLATGNSYSYRRTNYANWIFYRLTDIMLMKAEALTLKDNAGTNELQEAFQLVSAVYNRSNPGIGQDTLVYGTYASVEKMEDLVRKERQRELLFEGKRWYDLVRMCRRDGNNNRMLDLVIPKYTENQNAIRSKMTSPYALYFPIAASELKVNKKLKQNPIYNTGEISHRN